MSFKKIAEITVKVVIIIALIVYVVPQIARTFIYPKKYSAYVNKMAASLSIDEHIIYSIIKCESNFRADAISNRGAKGLMQIMDNTANEMYISSSHLVDDIYDVKKDILKPELNITLGSTYIKTLMLKYQDFGLAAAAYNAGMGNVDKWIKEGTIDRANPLFYENIPFPETKAYVIKAIKTRKMYDNLYN